MKTCPHCGMVTLLYIDNVDFYLCYNCGYSENDTRSPDEDKEEATD